MRILQALVVLAGIALTAWLLTVHPYFYAMGSVCFAVPFAIALDIEFAVMLFFGWPLVVGGFALGELLL